MLDAAPIAACVAAAPEVDLGATESLCPACLRRIPARRVERAGEVRLLKRCPEHGDWSAVIWRGPPSWAEWGAARARGGPRPPLAASCPTGCGLCEGHAQPTCCALLEVTGRCNLRCPICFAAAGEGPPDPPLEALLARLRALAGRGPVNLQLSGGEPTLRDDLPELISRGRALGVPFFQLNTNGLRLAREPGYAERLRDAGLGCVFLQLDGVDDRAFLALRGARLLALKRRAIERCREARLGVVLVPTLVPGVNTHAVGDLLRFALAQGPAVRGIHFQPVSWFGRCPRTPRDQDRVTLPEVLRLLEQQGGGLVRAAWLHPPASESPHCSFSGTFARQPDRSLRPAGEASRCCSAGDRAGEARRAREHVALRWAHPAVPAPQAATRALDEFLARAAEASFCVSAMAFQDAWTVDLDRLRDCHLHVAGEDAAGGLRLIPFCAFNLTSASGAPLHRGRGGGGR